MNRPETVEERRQMWFDRQFNRETEKERPLIIGKTIEKIEKEIEKIEKENEELRKELALLNG